MKTPILTTLALASASLLTTSTFAQSTWQTVDDYQLAPGKVAGVAGMAAMADGVVFSAGGADDSAGVRHGLLRRSLDGGQTWINVLDLPNTHSCWSVTIGASGLVFATANANSRNWITTRSADGGATWAIVDSWLSPGSAAAPYAVVEDPAGRIFSGGYIADTSSRQHFFIRRSLDGGSSWTTVQDLKSPSGHSSVWALAATPAGVFAAGRYNTTSWIVRRSTDGGQTWNTVDTYYSGSSGNFPYGMATDASGNLYVTGTAYISPGPRKPAVAHWITRRSINGGQTWTVVDDFVPGSFNQGRAVTVDAFGRVFATGCVNLNGVYRWITRASLDGGATWVTTDDVPLLSSAGTPRAASADAVGNVFIGGQAPGTDGVNHGVVRQLAVP